MIIDELKSQIGLALGFTPTNGQAEAIDTFCRFWTSRTPQPVMVLTGSAGTGKTSLAAALVKTLHHIKQRMILLAPTGRAAKVFSQNASLPAYTIHRKIYRQRSFGGNDTGFNLNDNLHRDTLFLVDEASMVANNAYGDTAHFGSGCLLDDLVHYVYSGDNCRLMLIGDKAQLPPVGEEESPALMPQFLQGYGLSVYHTNLDEVLRQAADSVILYNATVVRKMITHDQLTQLPLIRFARFADIVMVPGGELIEQLAGSYSEVGTDETIVVTRSNKRANIYNAGIRNMVLGREENLCSGDMLMVVKNNYYWTEKEKDSPLSFIANGDRAIVQRVRGVRSMYGFMFADVWLRFPDYNDHEMQVTALMDSLTSEAPSLTREQSERLFAAVLEDYQDLTLKAERMKALRNDAYFNALQIKFAYSVTCHKAQGGQWAHVYLDQGYMTDDMLTPDYIHWLYTAFTRATEKLFLVNWPKTQIEP
ncbi:MAG: AAA family ATPase [Prevotella sp.]|nr:AAA family ATPase [Prevotella sp.]